MHYQMEPIGIIRSPYKEKFAIPRQPNLAKSGQGELHLLADYNNPDAVRGIEQFSHLWLVFIFDQNIDKGWHPTVRPPRLGGNERLGVFATRSTFRPNPIGLSAVELKDVVYEKNQVILKLGSIDLVDNTPIIDIKPYIPYSDSYPDAKAGYAQQSPEPQLEVSFSTQAVMELAQYQAFYPQLAGLIEEVLAQDPRPAYKKANPNAQEYGITLFDFNIRWMANGQHATVLSINKLTDN